MVFRSVVVKWPPKILSVYDETIDVQAGRTNVSVRAKNVIEKFDAGRETRRHRQEIVLIDLIVKPNNQYGVKRDFRVNVVTKNNKLKITNETNLKSNCEKSGKCNLYFNHLYNSYVHACTCKVRARTM